VARFSGAATLEDGCERRLGGRRDFDPHGEEGEWIGVGSSLQNSIEAVDREIVMVQAQMTRDKNDDPRKLSSMLARISDLAETHSVCSVIVGVAADEGDLLFPDYLAYLESALRVEDQIFRMTRERAVLYLSDVDATGAAEVLVRIFAEFCEEFPTSKAPEFAQRMLEIKPGLGKLSVKEVLTSVFGSREILH
jgi:hypothetical protein